MACIYFIYYMLCDSTQDIKWFLSCYSENFFFICDKLQNITLLKSMEDCFHHWIKNKKKKVIATFLSHNSDILFLELRDTNSQFWLFWYKLAIASL